MSLNVNPLGVQRVIDPRLEITEGKKRYNVVGGAMINAWRYHPATNVSNSNFSISCNPPSRDICVSRYVLKKVVFSWTITGVNSSGGKLLNDGYIAPRALPLTSVTQSESITLGGDTITQAPLSQYWRALLRYRNDLESRNGVFSLCPNMLDQHQEYSDGVGGIRNPLAGYDDNSSEFTRGSYVGFTIDPQTFGNTTATGTLTTYEPILMSPFAFGENCNSLSSFIGLGDMSYNVNLGKLSRILSVVQGQGVPTGEIVLNEPIVNVESAGLLFNYFTPDPTFSPIPSISEYSYYQCVPHPTKYHAPISPGQTVSITMNSIQVQSIPKRVYIFAREDDSTETAFTTDTYMSLPRGTNPLTVNWDNNIFLSTAQTEDIYNIAVKNGCNLSYTQFTDKVGSVVALDFGIDIGLQPNQSPGSLGNYQFQITCSFTNTKNRILNNVSLFVVVVSEGVFNINNGVASHMIGVLSPDDILNAPLAPEGSYNTHRDVYGGSWNSFKNMLKKGLGYAKEHKLISKGLASSGNPYGVMASKVASALGYGLSGGNIDFNNNHKIKKGQKNLKLSDMC